MIIGEERVYEAALSYGYKSKYLITLEEIVALFPEICSVKPNNINRKFNSQVLERIGMSSIDQARKELKFGAIFMMEDTQNTAWAMQICVDILGSKDGSLEGERR